MPDNLGNIVDDNLDIEDNFDTVQANGKSQFGTSYERVWSDAEGDYIQLDSGYDNSPDVIMDNPTAFSQRTYYDEVTLNTGRVVSAGFALKGGTASRGYDLRESSVRDIPDMSGQNVPVRAIADIPTGGDVYAPVSADTVETIQLGYANSNQPNDTLVIQAIDSAGLTRKFVADDLSTDVRWD